MKIVTRLIVSGCRSGLTASFMLFPCSVVLSHYHSVPSPYCFMDWWKKSRQSDDPNEPSQLTSRVCSDRPCSDQETCVPVTAMLGYVCLGASDNVITRTSTRQAPPEYNTLTALTVIESSSSTSVSKTTTPTAEMLTVTDMGINSDVIIASAERISLHASILTSPAASASVFAAPPAATTIVDDYNSSTTTHNTFLRQSAAAATSATDISTVTSAVTTITTTTTTTTTSVTATATTTIAGTTTSTLAATATATITTTATTPATTTSVAATTTTITTSTAITTATPTAVSTLTSTTTPPTVTTISVATSLAVEVSADATPHYNATIKPTTKATAIKARNPSSVKSKFTERAKTLTAIKRKITTKITTTANTRAASVKNQPEVSAARKPSGKCSSSTRAAPGRKGSHSYVGCYVDNELRILPHVMCTSQRMTTNMCFIHCSENNYTYFGTEAVRECFCGDVIPSTATKSEKRGCHELCGGAKFFEVCGGSWRISVYRIN